MWQQEEEWVCMPVKAGKAWVAIWTKLFSCSTAFCDTEPRRTPAVILCPVHWRLMSAELAS